MRTLYSKIDPYRTGSLKVSDRHELYFEESGNSKGKCVLFIHGGPGSSTSAIHRRFFDPQYYRIILLDQRGCGKSKPYASLEENTTPDLVEDMEKLRAHLGVERWQLFGGSWGSALSLAYAERYPDRVTELVLRGIFMLRKKEIAWFYQRGANVIFPEAFEEYSDFIAEGERDDLVRAYYRRLTSDDAEVQIAAAKAWCRWEASTSFLRPRPDYIAKFEDEKVSLAFARIECHYFVHGGFFSTETQLLDQLGSIRHIPAKIVQGRYDVVCPAETAWELGKAWPEAEFKIVQTAGHSALETDIIDELVSATDSFRKKG